LIFACGLVGFSSQLRSRAFVPLLPVMLPVAAITLGAVETRFFLPVYVVLMGMAVMRFDRRVFMRFTCDHRWSVLTFYVVWTAAFVAITTSTMAESMLVLP